MEIFQGKDMKFDIQQENGGSDVIVPGLSQSAVSGDSEEKSNAVVGDEVDRGREGDDHLQIVLDDNSSYGPRDLEDDDEDTVTQVMEAVQGAEGKIKKEGEEPGKPINGVAGIHSQFKYGRPVVAPMPGASLAPEGVPGQAHPVVSMGPVAGPPQSKTGLTMQKGFHPGLGMPGWGNSMGIDFGGGLDFTLPSYNPALASTEMTIVQALPRTGESDAQAKPSAVPTFISSQSVTNADNQAFDDPFGDGPFRANKLSQSDIAHEQNSTSVPPFQAPSTNSQFLPQELTSSNQDTAIDILADILPPSGPSDAVDGHQRHDLSGYNKVDKDMGRAPAKEKCKSVVSVEVREVWKENFEEEFDKLCKFLGFYPFLEDSFPYVGIAATSENEVEGSPRSSICSDERYKLLKRELVHKLQQLGVALVDKASKEKKVWNFNFLDVTKGKEQTGIDTSLFAERLPKLLHRLREVKLVAYRSGYVIGKLVAMHRNDNELPETLNSFMGVVEDTLPPFYDIKYLLWNVDKGLDDIASELGGISRIGDSRKHAGSNALLAAMVILAMKKAFPEDVREDGKGVIYELSDDIDMTNVISKTTGKFS